MIHRAAVALLLGLVAGATGVLVAPQTLFLVVWLFSWLPHAVLQPAAFLVYEVALWASGLAVLLIARRVGWRPHMSISLLIVAAPCVMEITLALGSGRLPAALVSPMAASSRLAVGAIALVALRLLTRPSAASADDAQS